MQIFRSYYQISKNGHKIVLSNLSNCYMLSYDITFKARSNEMIPYELSQGMFLKYHNVYVIVDDISAPIIYITDDI